MLAVAEAISAAAEVHAKAKYGVVEAN